MYVLGPTMLDMSPEFVKHYVNVPVSFNCEKIRKELNFQFSPVDKGRLFGHTCCKSLHGVARCWLTVAHAFSTASSERHGSVHGRPWRCLAALETPVTLRFLQ